MWSLLMWALSVFLLSIVCPCRDRVVLFRFGHVHLCLLLQHFTMLSHPGRACNSMERAVMGEQQLETCMRNSLEGGKEVSE